MIDHKLYFRKAGPPAGTQDITLKWGDNLISFRPRVTGVQQVDQVIVRARNPAQQPAVRGDRAGRPSRCPQIGITRSQTPPRR